MGLLLGLALQLLQKSLFFDQRTVVLVFDEIDLVLVFDDFLLELFSFGIDLSVCILSLGHNLNELLQFNHCLLLQASLLKSCLCEVRVVVLHLVELFFSLF